MLTLPEKLFIITLADSDNSSSSLNFEAKFLHSLAGAILLELILQNQVQLTEDGKIIWQNTDNQLDSTSNQLIELATKPNWALYAVKAKKNAIAENLKDWLMVGAKIPNLRHQIALQLAQKNILATRPSKFLGMKVSTHYDLIEKEYKTLIIKQLNEVVFNQKTPDLAETMLLHLLKISNKETTLLNPEQLKDKKFKQDFLEKFAISLQNARQSKTIEIEIKKLLADDARDKIMDALDIFNNAIDAIADAIGDAGDSGGGDGGGDGGGGD
jgi:hypothetical protein